MKQNSGTLLKYCRGAAVGVSMLFLSLSAFAGGLSVLSPPVFKLALKL